MDRPPRFRRPHALLLAIATTLMLAVVGTASAGAASSIEGFWEFEHGQITIQPASNGTFEGIVAVETKFAECTHKKGEDIWKDITPQPDGSYWGEHQWFYEKSEPPCTPNPTRGKAAFRVLEAKGGSHYLRVCLSEPGGPQPTIAVDGAPKEASEYAAYNVGYGCFNSVLTAELEPPLLGDTPPGTPGSGASEPGKAASGVAGSRETLTLPSAKQCLSARLFEIHLAESKYDPFKTVSVTLRGHKVATVHKGKYVVATIDLEGMSKGTFTVKIHATTVLGHHLSASRTYHTCVPKIRPLKKSKQ